jgi:hypothetical protein
MSIYYCKKTRRQFLVGSGKALLAIPLLTSVMPLEALAQATTAPKRLMLFWFDHNNLNELWPQRNLAQTAVGTSGSREVLLRSLGAISNFSPVLRNPRYESLKNADQISIVRGLDTSVAYGPAHGNFTLASGIDRNSEGNFPTLDTVLESSRTLYPTNTPSTVRKAVRVNLLGTSLFYQKVGNSVQTVPGYASYQLQNMYNEVFAGLTGGTTAPADNTNQLKSNILNRVFGSYTDFRNNRRISSEDRARLDQHMSYISDLQNSLNAAAPPQAPTCARPNDPGQPVDPRLYNQLYMDLLATAFRCGQTKVGVMALEAHDPQWIPGLNTLGVNVHDAIHGAAGNAIQQRAFQTWWTYFADMIADRFLAPLDVIEGNTGRTYLQNMVTAMICAGGTHSVGGDGGHSGLDSNQVLIGNMGGALRSGRLTSMPTGNMPYNCFLITLLNLMGVPPAEYAFATPDGQGFGYYGQFRTNHAQRGRFYQPITEILT